MKTILIAMLLLAFSAAAMGANPDQIHLKYGANHKATAYNIFVDMVMQQCASIEAAPDNFKCGDPIRYRPTLIFTTNTLTLSRDAHDKIVFAVEAFAVKLASYHADGFFFREPGWGPKDWASCGFYGQYLTCTAPF